MGTSETDLNDFYHDDPAPQIPKSKLPSKFITAGAVILGSIFFFQSTFAGNISLSSGTGIEFGQGVSQAVACSGETDLTLTPRSSFTNGSPGAHYLQSVTVSDIPESCYGVDFTISAYNDSSSTPLALFNTSSTAAVIYNNAGTFSRGTRVTGMTVESGSGTFTATFTVPVAQSSSVFKLTIQSGLHFVYKVGDSGPGGGTVFYVNDAGFYCGPTRTATCTYLEAAPALWSAGGEEPSRRFAQTSTLRSQTVSNASSPQTATATAIGWGYRNTLAIILQGSTLPSSSAAALADSYSLTVGGVVVDDWYLPSADELNQMCKWQRGVPWTSDATRCSGGTMNTGPGAAGFIQDEYSSSTDTYADSAFFIQFGDFYGDPGFGDPLGSKSNYLRVRPIRAF